MSKLSFFLLLLLAPVHVCLAQSSKSSDSASSALMAFERELESAAARGDVEFLRRAIADDFTFTHGDAWRTGEKPGRVDTKQSWMDAVAITTGRIDVKLKPPRLNAGKAEYAVWFVRLYRAKGDGWELVSHRTVAEFPGQR